MPNPHRIDIDHVARLSRIALSDEEKEMLSSQLDSIIGYVNKLEELDTEGVEPAAHPHPFQNVWRSDAPTGELDREEAIRNAPDSRQGMVAMPRVVE